MGMTELEQLAVEFVLAREKARRLRDDYTSYNMFRGPDFSAREAQKLSNECHAAEKAEVMAYAAMLSHVRDAYLPPAALA